MNVKQEIIDAIQTLVDANNKQNANIVFGICTSVGEHNKCTVRINQIDYTLTYYGLTLPKKNVKYPVFIPYGNMSLAFIITTGAGVEGEGNNVTSVNGQVGDVVLSATDVNAYSKAEANTKFLTKENANTLLDNKVDKESGKGLSTNDYTTAEKNKLSGIAENANNYSLPTASASVLGGVKVGTNLSITNGILSATDTTYSDATSQTHGLMSTADKTKLDGFSSASNYALKSDISSMYKYRGSKATYANLPTSGNTIGDVWNVEENDMNYAWTGSAWDSLGSSFSIDNITNAEIDEMFK